MKPYHNENSQNSFTTLFLKILPALAVVFSIILIHSCRKEQDKSKPVGAQIVSKNYNINFSMLKNFYKKGIASSSLKTNDINPQLIGSLIGNLNVDWTTYTLTNYPDSTQIIEFAIPDDSTLAIPETLSVNDTIKYHSKTSVVFI